jgi:hypothetical protein
VHTRVGCTVCCLQINRHRRLPNEIASIPVGLAKVHARNRKL